MNFGRMPTAVPAAQGGIGQRAIRPRTLPVNDRDSRLREQAASVRVAS
jgi:hypothetical protein